MLVLALATSLLAIGCNRSQREHPKGNEVCHPPASALDITMGRNEVTRQPLGSPAKLADGTLRPTFARLSGDDAFSICGVKNGDIGLAVNGVQLDSPDKALASHRAFLEAPLWTLELLRDGRRMRVLIATR